jgi:hypothetical protein
LSESNHNETGDYEFDSKEEEPNLHQRSAVQLEFAS